jgi:ribosomal protein S12 methylthiotransferase accessory factor YcaO
MPTGRRAWQGSSPAQAVMVAVIEGIEGFSAGIPQAFDITRLAIGRKSYPLP